MYTSAPLLPAAAMTAHTAPPPDRMIDDGDALDNIDLGEILSAVISSWPILLVFALIGYGIGKFNSYQEPNTYQADALLQVENKSNQARIALAQTADFVDQGSGLPSEIEILKSRMVLGEVADALGLDIQVTPSFFPVVGEAVWRNYRAPGYREPPQWLQPTVRRRHVWGGESATVTTFNVPDALENRRFVIAANGDGSYDFLNARFDKLAVGRVGDVLRLDVPEGEIVLFVKDLDSPEGRLFYVRKQPLQVAARRIEGRLSATPRGGDGWRSSASILELRYSGGSPNEVTRTLAKILDVFQQQNVERRSAEAEKTLEFLKGQLPELRQQVETAESRLNNFMVDQGTADLSKETEIVLQRAVELDQTRNELVQKRTEALRQYTENHPVVKAINEEIARIDSRRARIDQRVGQLPDAQQRALQLRRDVEVYSALYVSLLNRAQELEVVKSGTIGNVRIIDPPVKPLGPSGPNRAQLVGLPIAVALMLAIGLILARYFLRNGVHDPAVLENKLGIPTFGMIPFSHKQAKLVRKREKNADASTTTLLASTDPNSVAMESIKAARTALFFAQMDAPNNAIMITGPEPGVGKSFVSSNLATSLAEMDKRVILVDGDLRRGTMHSVFGLERGMGLSEAISGQADLDQAIQKTHIATLDVLTTGTIPPNPAELLINDRFVELLQTLESIYDFVLIDTPPILAVTDAAIIGRHTGTSFVVLKAGEHPLRMIEDCLKRVTASGARVTGTIFNQVGRRQGGRFGYGYGYGYGYKYGGKHGAYAYEYRSQK